MRNANTMKLSLNTNTVRAMIAEDSEFEIQIKKAVITNVINGLFNTPYGVSRNAIDHSRNLINDEVSKEIIKQNPKLTAKIREQIRNAIQKEVDSVINFHVRSMVKTKVSEALKDLK